MRKNKLRRQAERTLSEKLEKISEIPGRDVQTLIHELQVHQIELEMQNDELRKAHLELEDSRKKYYELYEFAPVGYFTLNEKGLILEVNLAGADLLGMERRYVIRTGFLRYLSAESQNRFHHYRKQAIETRREQAGEIRLLGKDGTSLYGQIRILAVQQEEDPVRFQLTVSDITDRRRAEKELQRSHDLLEEMVSRRTEALRQSEAKYRELVQNANSIIFRRDPQGHVTFFNEYAQSFFGYSEEEILGRHVVGTIVPERDSEGRNMAAMIEDISRNPDRHASNINENMRRNGEPVWVAWANRAIRDENGEIREILCVGNDITALKKTREALQATEERYRLLAENAFDIIWTADLDLNFTYFSPSVERMLGYRRKDVAAHFMDRILTPEARDSVIELAEKIRKSVRKDEKRKKLSRPRTIELCLFRRDGQRIWTETMLTFIRGNEGKEDMILGVTRDITERKKAEKERWESEHRYRLLFEASPVGICNYDRDLLLVEWNDHFEKVIQSDRKRLEGFDLNTLTDRSLIMALQTPFEGRNGFYEGFYRTTMSQTEMWITLRTSPLFDMEGNVTSAVAMMENITEGVMARKALQESQAELEAKSLFLAETNTALRVLLRRIEDDKAEIEENIMSNIKKLILPLVEKVRVNPARSGREALLQVLEANLNNVISPFLRNMSLKPYNLTPKELHVANLIREGKTTKEIANMLNVSERSVEFHRDNIRKKLNLKGKKENLQSLLISMS